METITLQNLLPVVFRESAGEAPVAGSEIWLRESLTFVRPAMYMVEAESGAGKSSLCSFIYGTRTDYDGTILFDGEDVRTFSPERWCEIRRTGLAWLPQELRLFPQLTALENVEIKNSLTSRYTRAEIMTMFARLGIADKADTAAARLSVGQQQRVAIIRALCQPFSFLLVDEPVSHLDARNNATVASLIVETAAGQGASVIATSVGNQLSLPSFTLLRL